MRAPEALTRAVRERGGKVTPQRQLLFSLLHGNETHPSAEALYEVASARMPGISLRTVYQTLTELVAMGELQRIELGAGSARFDPNTDQHHHLVCTVCGEVRDVYLATDRTPAAALDDVDGFRVTATEIVFRGECAHHD